MGLHKKNKKIDTSQRDDIFSRLKVKTFSLFNTDPLQVSYQSIKEL